MQTHDLAAKAWKAMPDTVGRRLSDGQYTAPPHVRLISWLLHLNAHRYVPRVGVSMPPGSGKSEIIDYYDSVTLLEHDPTRRIILASYSGELAEEQGKRVRNTIESNYDLLNVRLMQDSRAADRWRTTEGGGMWTVGIGGSITGRRASNLKIDDPHKNFAEASSQKNQIDTWNWYGSVARTRMLPRSTLAVVQTRWNEADLLGRIAANDENKNDWLFVALPAIAEQDETIQTILGDWYYKLTAMGITRFPVWERQQGQALWPELEPGVPWFDEQEYGEIRSDVGEVIWAGLYQQRPAPAEGNLFKRYDWRRLDGPMPAGQYTFIRRWDLASTEGGDWTAGCLMAMNHDTRHIYIVDCRRARLGPTEVEQFVHMTAVEDRDNYGHVLTRVEREPGSAGVANEVNYMANVLSGFPAKFLPSSGSKEIRALPFSGQVGARNVYLCRRVRASGETTIPDWWEWLIEEAAVFPNGAHDDLVDVASLAYVDLVEELPRRSKVRVGSSARKQLGF